MIDTEAWRCVADKLIGVIDLKDSLAVHGIAGNREHYLPVGPLQLDHSSAEGRPTGLVDWYRRFGIRKFYLADLDALMGGEMQVAAIEDLLKHSHQAAESWMIDVGIREHTLNDLVNWIGGPGRRFAHVDWILSSESAASPDLIQAASRSIEPTSLILGVDFRAGQFVGPSSGLDAWLDRAAACQLTRALVLDVAAVGTKEGPVAGELCRALHQQYPNWNLISGGGCRNVQDIADFLDAGCKACLIASALLPSPSPHSS